MSKYGGGNLGHKVVPRFEIQSSSGFHQIWAQNEDEVRTYIDDQEKRDDTFAGPLHVYQHIGSFEINKKRRWVKRSK